MDARRNPYAPGAGYPPPELAGRDELIERAAVALDRIRHRRAARSLILYGLRGVGKTVLLNRIRRDAESQGIVSVQIEAPEGKSLPAMLVPALRATLLKVDRMAAFRAKTAGWAERTKRVLASFVSAARVKYGDIEVALDLEPESGVADSGNLEMDLTDLLTTVGHVAAEHGTAIVLFIDELQYVREEQLAALVSALHRVSQDQLPVAMVGAGLPQLVGMTGRAKSYAERLFEFTSIDKLDPEAARAALCKPAAKEDVTFSEEAIQAILQQTQGYPYFLQEWGKHSWDLAEVSPIQRQDAEGATIAALADLDASFFRVRFDRATPTEKRYMRAMADLGAGQHRSGDIADRLGRRVTAVAPIRNALIAKGMIYSPAHGDTAFTVPLFEGFMKRVMPEL